MVLNGATPQSSALLGELAAIGTLPALFAWRVRTTPRAEAYRVYDEAAAQWRSVSWSEAGARVDRFAAALTGTGLPRGARVAILLVNGLDGSARTRRRWRSAACRCRCTRWTTRRASPTSWATVTPRS